jgi:hypothetical protein
MNIPKIAAVLVALFYLSIGAYIYKQARLVYWFETHRYSQGMPNTIDMQVAEILAKPVVFIKGLIVY